ncbi:hypothetical protein V1511DRAFT_511975 [Dipodascopsis uninucleata]
MKIMVHSTHWIGSVEAGSSFKTNRRQHRSCDQCRKGKRACDVTLLNELWSSNSAVSPAEGSREAVTDGSSVIDRQTWNMVSPVVHCTNCTKTGKDCTIEWLRRSQKEIFRRKRETVEAKKLKGRSRQSNGNGVNRKQREGSARGHVEVSSESLDTGSHVISLSPATLFNECSFSPPLFDGLYTTESLYAEKSDSINCLSQGNEESINHSNLLLQQQLLHNSTSSNDITKDNDSNSDDRNSGTSIDQYDSYDESMEAASLNLENSAFGCLQYSSLDEESLDFRNMSNACNTSQDADSNNQDDPSLRYSYRHNRRNMPHRNVAPYGLKFVEAQHDLSFSTNKSFLTHGLLRIYHDSVENAFSCWLTERNCPYSADISVFVNAGPMSKELQTGEWGHNWSNRIFARVCRLDRVSSVLRGRPLTQSEDIAVSKSLHLAILAFATQWAQSSHRSVSQFPTFKDSNISESISSNTGDCSQSIDSSATLDSDSDPLSSINMEFDRLIQETLWNQARQELQNTAGIESFRVVFAHIIFSLTQRPQDISRQVQILKAKSQFYSKQSCRKSSVESDTGFSPDLFENCSASSNSSSNSKEQSSMTMSDLDQFFELEGPPVFLETALRQIFSSSRKLEKLRMQRARNLRDSGVMTNDDPILISTRTDPLCLEDRKTFNLLFWLCVMFDTVSSAMNRRPLVVPDEDCDIDYLSTTTNIAHQSPNKFDNESYSEGSESSLQRQSDNSLWGVLLFKQQENLRQGIHIPRWPCPYDQAAATLCDAAPIKVMLFRKVTRLQELTYKRATPHIIEHTIQESFEVYRHWNKAYGQFFGDCISNHHSLPPRIQSWYIVLAGHWHLAGLLLADILDEIDKEDLGLKSHRKLRQSSLLSSELRKQNAYAISELAKCSCPSDTSTFSQASEFHFALNRVALLTEPWTVILIRSFGKAGYILLDSLPDISSKSTEIEERRDRCEYCIQALWYLGKKSDIAHLAATALLTSLREKSNIYTQSLNLATPIY